MWEVCVSTRTACVNSEVTGGVMSLRLTPPNWKTNGKMTKPARTAGMALVAAARVVPDSGVSSWAVEGGNRREGKNG